MTRQDVYSFSTKRHQIGLTRSPYTPGKSPNLQARSFPLQGTESMHSPGWHITWRKGLEPNLYSGCHARSFPLRLLWQYGYDQWSRREVSRNHDFPSWSWAGWTGKAWYFFCDKPDLILNRVDWLGSMAATLTQPQGLAQAPVSNSGPRLLKFRAWTVTFRLERQQEVGISWEAAYHSNIDPGSACHYSTKILDSERHVAGGVDMRHLIDLEDIPDGDYELIVLSRTVLPGQWIRTDGQPSVPSYTPKPDEDRSDAAPSSSLSATSAEMDTLFRTMSSVARMRFLNTRLCDISRYNVFKPWPLYNVMVIKRIDNIAYRVAIGKIHIDAIWAAQPVKRLICLR